MEKLIMNSVDWWENEFSTGEWKRGIDGRLQTAYFMKLLINYILPLNFYGRVLDFGCALGQGLHELKQHYPDLELTGYDVAKRAIFEAKATYPYFNFTWNIPTEKFDFVVCSNVLEHFADNRELFDDILSLTKDYAIIMTPYDQIPSDIHPIRITENTFPVEHMNCVREKFIIVPPHNTDLCGCEQIIMIYRRLRQ